jgi:hypothetical protein
MLKEIRRVWRHSPLVQQFRLIQLKLDLQRTGGDPAALFEEDLDLI